MTMNLTNNCKELLNAIINQAITDLSHNAVDKYYTMRDAVTAYFFIIGAECENYCFLLGIDHDKLKAAAADLYAKKQAGKNARKPLVYMLGYDDTAKPRRIEPCKTSHVLGRFKSVLQGVKKQAFSGFKKLNVKARKK